MITMKIKYISLIFGVLFVCSACSEENNFLMYDESNENFLGEQAELVDYSQKVVVEANSDTSSDKAFTITQRVTVTLTIEIGRGFNEWWEISPFINETGAIITKKPTSVVKAIYMEPYIWNANPDSYMTYTEKSINLEPGEYILSAVFTKSLGPQYGASGKHGVARAKLEYTIN